MTCSGCQAKVKGLLANVKGVKDVSIDLAKGEALIDMEHHVPISQLKAALNDYPKYQVEQVRHLRPEIVDEEKKTWLETYKPVLLIFAYISGITLLVEYSTGGFSWMSWMNHFMAGFFLVFSFFKLINLKGFAESYSMYDVVAKNWNAWGYIYAFTELALGIAFLTGFNPIITNLVTLAVMSISLIGVLQSVLNKRKIKCACLGAVFNLPMSTITIIEDALMIIMSTFMLFHLLV